MLTKHMIYIKSVSYMPLLRQLSSDFVLIAAAVSSRQPPLDAFTWSRCPAVPSASWEFCGVLWSLCFLHLPAAVGSLIKWKLVAVPVLAALIGQSLCAQNNESNSWDVSNEIFF